MSRLTSPLVAAVLVLPLAAWADFKAGYVDMSRVLKEVHEGQAMQAKLEREASKRKGALDADQNKLRDDKLLLDKQASAMSAEIREQKVIEVQKRFVELNQKAEKVQLELQELGRAELTKILEKVDPIVAAIAQHEALTMVFDKATAGLVYAPPALDLTNEVVRTYNDKYKVAAVAAPKPEAPKK
ncbi:MAG: OmpH family outer membrane protein [Myxococcaceae bacterium]